MQGSLESSGVSLTPNRPKRVGTCGNARVPFISVVSRPDSSQVGLLVAVGAWMILEGHSNGSGESGDKIVGAWRTQDHRGLLAHQAEPGWMKAGRAVVRRGFTGYEVSPGARWGMVRRERRLSGGEGCSERDVEEAELTGSRQGCGSGDRSLR